MPPVAAANVSAPAGQIDSGSRAYAVSTHVPELSGSLVLAYRNGAPVRLSDVARVEDGLAPMACMVAPRGMVELDVHALQPDAVKRETVKRLQLVVAPDRPALRGEVDATLTPAAALERIADAVGSDAVAEIRGNQLVVRGASPAVVERLRHTVGLVALGEPAAMVHVFRRDPQAVAEAAPRDCRPPARGGQLVATHGLAAASTRRIEIDRPAAARLDVMLEEIQDALAASNGPSCRRSTRSWIRSRS